MRSKGGRHQGTSVVPSRLTLIACLAVAAVCGCARDASQSRRPRNASDLVRQVAVGQTTAADIEQRFGHADDRPPDGSLVYRFRTAPHEGARVDTDTETVTLRFERGVLQKICRARS